MKAIFPCLVLPLVLLACVAPQDDETTSGAGGADFGYSEQAKAECEAQKGSYARRGMLGNYTCAIPFADAGKSCSLPGDCEGQCRVESPEATVGKCQATTDPFGCYSYIDEELQVVSICVD